jgi:hypothetical protein
MELTPQQKSRLEKIAQLKDNENLTLASIIYEVADLLQDIKEHSGKNHYHTRQLVEDIEVPDHSEKLDTIISKLDEPED